jgi:tripartite ATP-independent transporter DctP family solute receptor
MMNRRSFMITTAAATAAAGVFAPTVLRAQQIRFQLGHGASPGNPRWIASEKFAELVKERTKGKVDIKVFGSEQLGGDAAMITAMRTGTLDLSPNTQGTAAAVAPKIAALGLPFLFKSMPHAHKVVDGAIGETIAKDFEAGGLILLAWWDNGIRHTTNSKRPIKVPADVKGLKIRTPADPMTIDIFQALGASTEQIKFSELYVALQQGVVDGQENPLANIFANKLHEVNPYIAMTGHKWESTPFLMSKMSWGRLGADEKKIVKDAAVESGVLQRKLLGETEGKLLVDFKANPKVTVTEVDQKPFQEATAAVYKKWEAQFGDFVPALRKAAAA